MTDPADTTEDTPVPLQVQLQQATSQVADLEQQVDALEVALHICEERGRRLGSAVKSMAESKEITLSDSLKDDIQEVGA